MDFVRYNHSHFETLLSRRDHADFPATLQNQSFVDWYYDSGDHCQLHMFLKKGELLGVVGIDTMTFMYDNQPMVVAVANNNVAFVPGIGGLQFLYWLKAAPYTLVFGGSNDTHAIMKKNGWHYFPAVPLWRANRRFQKEQNRVSLRAMAKWGLSVILPKTRLWQRKKQLIAQSGVALSVQEESHFHADMLPTASPFRFRLTPSLDYLQWRYQSQLSFINYRLFRVLVGAKTIGYVVLKDGSEQVMLSHCDGEDAVVLAYAVLLAMAEVSAGDHTPRELFLSSTHVDMQNVFRKHGFRNWSQTRPFVMGAFRSTVTMEDDMSQWLVNFDWNDNGLRCPFLND